VAGENRRPRPRFAAVALPSRRERVGASARTPRKFCADHVRDRNSDSNRVRSPDRYGTFTRTFRATVGGHSNCRTLGTDPRRTIGEAGDRTVPCRVHLRVPQRLRRPGGDHHWEREETFGGTVPASPCGQPKDKAALATAITLSGPADCAGCDQLAKVGVEGSNPFARSKIPKF
jgi:hypothetical protein